MPRVDQLAEAGLRFDSRTCPVAVVAVFQSFWAMGDVREGEK